jgi:hypothetical protein
VKEKEWREEEEAEQRERAATPTMALTSDVSSDPLADLGGFPSFAYRTDLPLLPSFWDSLDIVSGTITGDPYS